MYLETATKTRKYAYITADGHVTLDENGSIPRKRLCIGMY